MKRVFTDADIYEDEWYQELSMEHKLFWDYICRRAEYGIWKPNMRLAEFQLGVNISEETVLKAFNPDSSKPRVVITKNDRWFIPSWISFQFPTLSRDCPAHKPLFKFYERSYQYLLDTYLKGIYTLQEKEKEIEKEKDFKDFEHFWDLYPKKRSKNQALKAWKKLDPDERLQEEIMRSLEAAKTSEEWAKEGGQFIPYPATWLNAHGWKDELQKEAGDGWDKPYPVAKKA